MASATRYSLVQSPTVCVCVCVSNCIFFSPVIRADVLAVSRGEVPSSEGISVVDSIIVD